MNKSDSERIASILEKIGYRKASKENEADLILVNMCSVRQSAVDRVYGLAKKFAKLKSQNLNFKTILTGCILKSDRKKFSRKFDLILDIKDLPNWPKVLMLNSHDRTFYEHRDYLDIKPKHLNNFSAFVPIMTGCNNFCSYCVVPYTRGREISRSAEEILSEVKDLIKRGFKEIWLLGQNINSYYSLIRANKKINFAKLLKMVNDIPGNFWIRFTSPHPKNFSEELIETIAKCQKFAPYLNLPVQSGDDEILKKMNRPYTVKQYKNLVKKIRNAFKKYRNDLEKEIAISTDVIVGFPGETEKQFENTVKLFRKMKFDMAYIAKYSPRPGTAASKLKDDVFPEEKERRWKILTEILKKNALEKNKKFVGKEVEVLVEKQEKKNKKQVYFGKTKTYKTVKIQIQNTNYKLPTTNLVGQFVKVKIIEALPWGLRGILK
ncbi:MAG: tRNA (N6-isopentenyl adenosine(37)-C2)-methylthiotransferase MiaB [Candidatus Freyarchaeota archaeon]|nr:tRNA (N6-isopentenyl adenosine(37)-C2)-methylthiotransferase MiaB [Candidatus Jordarchaeia archaeon]